MIGEKDVLPPTLSLPEAARWLGISRGTAYQLARSGGLPVPVLRLGRRLRIPTALLLGALGVNAMDSPAVGRGGESPDRPEPLGDAHGRSCPSRGGRR
jgi:excisionase family DNA binding protein